MKRRLLGQPGRRPRRRRSRSRRRKRRRRASGAAYLAGTSRKKTRRKKRIITSQKARSRRGPNQIPIPASRAGGFHVVGIGTILCRTGISGSFNPRSSSRPRSRASRQAKDAQQRDRHRTAATASRGSASSERVGTGIRKQRR